MPAMAESASEEAAKLSGAVKQLLVCVLQHQPGLLLLVRQPTKIEACMNAGTFDHPCQCPNMQGSCMAHVKVRS